MNDRSWLSLVLPKEEGKPGVREVELASSGKEGEPKVDWKLVELVILGGGIGGTSGLGESRILRLRRLWLELAMDGERSERDELSKEARTGVYRPSVGRGSSASEPAVS